MRPLLVLTSDLTGPGILVFGDVLDVVGAGVFGTGYDGG